MRRFILTGAPGAGKTTLLMELKLLGYPIVEEAATTVIAEQQAQGKARPWEDATFIEAIMSLQMQRLLENRGGQKGFEFHDRSIIDTYILAEYLGFALSPTAADLLDRAIKDSLYEKQVLFIDDLGFIEKTAARQISYEAAQEFGSLHKQIYSALGFDCLHIPAMQVVDRVAFVEKWIKNLTQ